MAVQPIALNGLTPAGTIINNINPSAPGANRPQVNATNQPQNMWTQPARNSLLSNIGTANQLGFPDISNYLGGLVSSLEGRDAMNQGILDIYNAFGNNLYNMMGDRNSFYGSLNQDMLGQLSNLQQQYQNTYGPQGQMTRRINDLYGNYGNYLINKNASDRAYASGLASKYGLSDNARRISENDVGLQGLSEVLKIFDAETQALDNINKTFNTLTTDAFGRYKGIQDDYLKSLADSNFGVQTELNQGLINLLANNEQIKNQLKLQQQYARSGGSTPLSNSTTNPGAATSTPTPEPVAQGYRIVGTGSGGVGNVILLNTATGVTTEANANTVEKLRAQGLIL